MAEDKSTDSDFPDTEKKQQENSLFLTRINFFFLCAFSEVLGIILLINSRLLVLFSDRNGSTVTIIALVEMILSLIFIGFSLLAAKLSGGKSVLPELLIFI